LRVQRRVEDGVGLLQLDQLSVQVITAITFTDARELTPLVPRLGARVGPKNTSPLLRPWPHILRLPLRESFVSGGKHSPQLDKRVQRHRGTPRTEPVVLGDNPLHSGASRIESATFGQLQPTGIATRLGSGQGLGAGDVLGTIGKESTLVGVNQPRDLTRWDTFLLESLAIVANGHGM